MDISALEFELVAGFCEHENEILVCIKFGGGGYFD
jgi:hypothetical protein